MGCFCFYCQEAAAQSSDQLLVASTTRSTISYGELFRGCLMCSATMYVRFGPEADRTALIQAPQRPNRKNGFGCRLL